MFIVVTNRGMQKAARSGLLTLYSGTKLVEMASPRVVYVPCVNVASAYLIMISHTEEV